MRPTLSVPLALAGRLALAGLIAVAGLALPAPAQEKAAAPITAPAPASPPRIQLAILLDTSGSMDGLIAQAKSQIWTIVNQMTRARMAGQRPELRVALYEYGKSSIPASEGHLRQILPLTDDLDEVSAQLFALTTNGGEEYCGRVIGAATEGLSWSSAPADLRILVIAGNEPFTQGDVPWQQTVAAAVKKGIIVNTIFCGNEAEGAGTGWRDGALRGEGTYGFIDQNAASVHIEAPQDKELAELSGQINTTYLGYGRGGAAMAGRQAQQDRNAASASPAAPAARAAAKASHAYKNSAWDLVDGLKEGAVKLEDLKDEELPESMRGKTLAEKERIVEEAAKERDRIRARIGQLSAAREQYISEQMKAKAGESTLEAALTKALREQAEKKGYAFQKP